MRARNVLLPALGLAVAGSAAFLLLRRPPEPDAGPTILEELDRAEGRAWSPDDTSAEPLTIRQEGQVLRVGSLAVDLARPAEELPRLIGLFRNAHAEFRKDRKGRQARLDLREGGTALGRLLMAHPSLGLAFFREMAKEPHPETLKDMARILQVCPSPELHRELVAILEAGGAREIQRAAILALARGPHPEAPRALLRTWQREDDPELRRKAMDVLAGILVHVPAEEGAKRALLDEFRRAAAASPDPERRLEVIGGLVGSQGGALGADDRTLMAGVLEQEKDPSRKARLEHLAGKIREP